MDLPERLARLAGAPAARELTGGHQSRVFAVAPAAGGPRVVVKAVDASSVDRAAHEVRVAVVAELARIDRRVCRPLPLDGRLVTALDLDDGSTVLVTCWEHAAGAPPVVADPADAHLMGQTLALLHRSMRAIGPTGLPLVAALRAAPGPIAGGVQLVHGDYDAGNLRRTDGSLRVFDFDDCGYGPAAFDVANALYVVLFSETTGGTAAAYRSFEAGLLAGYGEVCGHDLDRDELHGFVDRRVAALASWLDDLTTAPPGIRTATPEWQATLRSFVAAHRSGVG